MARGWESKSVEAQIEDSESIPSTNQENTPSPEELQARIKRDDLTLSRRRILQELEGTSNERYSELLRRTLAGLEAQIADLS